MKVLVPLDGSQVAEQVLPHALSFARRFDAELSFLHVIEPKGSDPDKPFEGLDWELHCAHCDSYLESVKQTLADQRVTVRCEVIEGDPATEIIEFCRRRKMDLLMLSTQGAGGAGRFPRGGTVGKILSRADRSILLVNSAAHPLTEDLRYRRILVPVDGSRRSDWALSLAAAIATGHGAELELVQVIEEPRMPPRVRESAEGRRLVEHLIELNRREAHRCIEEVKGLLPRDLSTRFRVVVASEVASAIDQAAETGDVDLVILSAHGWSADRHQPFGPVVETLLAHASRPVLVLQDTLENGFALKPASGAPIRTARADRRQSAEAG